MRKWDDEWNYYLLTIPAKHWRLVWPENTQDALHTRKKKLKRDIAGGSRIMPEKPQDFDPERTPEELHDKLHEKLGEVAAGRLVKSWDVSALNRETNEWTTTRNYAYDHEGQAEDFNYLTQAAPVKLSQTKINKRNRNGLILADLPDLQWGYREIEPGKFLETHDPEAVDLALQITKDLQPDRIILGGDELDLPQLGRWDKDSRQMVNTLQMSIDGLHRFMARLRGDNPDARITNLTSNHVKRFGDYMMKNAFELFGIRPANMPQDWAALSYPRLMRLDELNIEYSEGGYPAGMEKINEGLYTFHGDKAHKWSTAGEYIKEYDFSVMFHHDHRRGVASRTLPSGKQVMAFSNGCLARITGEVPGYGTSVGERGEIGARNANWEQGIGVVFYEEDSDWFMEVHVPFRRNEKGQLTARLFDKTYTANPGGFSGLERPEMHINYKEKDDKNEEL